MKINLKLVLLQYWLVTVHCNENPICVIPEKELRGLSPHFYIQMSVSELYIPRIGPHILLQAE